MARRAIGRRDSVLIGDSNEMAALKGRDLLTLCGASEARRFTLSQEDNELARSSHDIRIINAAADYVRNQNCRQILIALPWSDAGELIRNQLKSLPVDELPQLWNVLRGDMSLIGPRPHALAHDNYFETLLSDYAFRQSGNLSVQIYTPASIALKDQGGSNGNQHPSAPSVTLWARHRFCPSTSDDPQRGCAPPAGKAHRFGFFACDGKVGEVASADSLGYWRSDGDDGHRN
jgi:hypothetical protein